MPENLSIPPTLHQIWLGGAPIPPQYQRHREFWRTLHPDWDILLWDEEAIWPLLERYGLTQSFLTVPTQASRSDIARYAILLERGGVYADMDVVPLQNLEALLSLPKGRTVFLGSVAGRKECQAVMGSVPGSGWLRDVVGCIANRVAANPHKDAAQLVGPYWLRQFYSLHSELHFYPPKIFYPYRPDDPKRKHYNNLSVDALREAFPESFAVHQWAHSWGRATVQREGNGKLMSTNRPVQFGVLEHKAEHVIIVGSGPSLENFSFRSLEGIEATIIAVNRAIQHVPRADFWFTMDTHRDMVALMRKQPVPSHYVAAVPSNFGDPSARNPKDRVQPPDNVTYLRRRNGRGPCASLKGLSDDPAVIHGGNSAYGALGLAYLMQAQRIILLGVDGKTGGHFYNLQSRTGDLAHLPWLFESAVAQLKGKNVQVLNGSVNSAVTCFPRMTAQEALQELSGGRL